MYLDFTRADHHTVGYTYAKMVKDLGKTSTKSKTAKTDEKLETIYREYEEKLKKAVGTKIAISSKGDGSGKLEIDFYSHDDLDRITRHVFLESALNGSDGT